MNFLIYGNIAIHPTINVINIPKIVNSVGLKVILISANISSKEVENTIGAIAINIRTYLPFSKPSKRVAGINIAVKNIPIPIVTKGITYIGIEETKYNYR